MLIILLGEDDQLLGETSKEVLAQFGDVAWARTREDALFHLQARTAYDLVITDLDLGRRDDGIRILRQAKSKHPKAVRVLMTGDALFDPAEHAELFDRFISKVANEHLRNELRAVCEDALEHKRRRPVLRVVPTIHAPRLLLAQKQPDAFIHGQLLKKHYEVTTVIDKLEFHKIKGNEYDVVLADWEDWDDRKVSRSIWVLYRAKQFWPNAVRILLTAHKVSEDYAPGVVDRIIIKPASMGYVHAMIDQALHAVEEEHVPAQTDEHDSAAEDEAEVRQVPDRKESAEEEAPATPVPSGDDVEAAEQDECEDAPEEKSPAISAESEKTSDETGSAKEDAPDGSATQGNERNRDDNEHEQRGSKWGWRRWSAVAAAVLVVGFSGLLVKQTREPSKWSTLCDAPRMASMWASQRDDVSSSFLKTEVPFAGHAMARVGKALSAQATAIDRSLVAFCEAPSTMPNAELGAMCLRDRRAEFQALTRLMSKADPTTVELSATAVEQLDDPEDCLRWAKTAKPFPEPPPGADDLADQLQRAHSYQALGRYDEAVVVVETALKEAYDLDYAPLTALAHLRAVQAYEESGELAKAVDEAEQAAALAWIDGAHPYLESVGARAWIARLYILGRLQADPERALETASLVKLAVNRVGSNRLRAMYASSLGLVHEQAGDLSLARKHLEEALDLGAEVFGPKSLQTAKFAQDLSIVLVKQKELIEAEETSRRAVETITSILGPAHPHTALALDNHAGILAYAGQYEQALAVYRNVLDVRRTILPRNHRSIGVVHLNLAMILENLRRVVDATSEARRAVEVLAESDSESLLVRAYIRLGVLYQKQGELDEAFSTLIRARALAERVSPSKLGDILSLLCDIRRAQGRPRDAKPYCKEADPR